MNQSIHTDLIDETIKEIIGRNLPQVDATKVVYLPTLIPRQKEHLDNLPLIVVSDFGFERLNPLDGTEAEDDFGYPVTVAIVDKVDEQEAKTRRDLRRFWRQELIDWFHYNELGVDLSRFGANIDSQIVEPGPVTDWAFWQAGWDVGGFILRVNVRRLRRYAP